MGTKWLLVRAKCSKINQSRCRHAAGLPLFKSGHVLAVPRPQRASSSQNLESHKNIIVQRRGSFVHFTKDSKTKTLPLWSFGMHFLNSDPLPATLVPTLTSQKRSYAAKVTMKVFQRLRGQSRHHRSHYVLALVLPPNRGGSVGRLRPSTAF